MPDEPSVFDIPGDNDDGEKSPDSPQEGDKAQAERKKPSDESQVPDDSRIASLERQLSDVQGNVLDVVAENAALKTKLKIQETGTEKEPTRYAPEELKTFSLEDDGTKQFDAAKLYADQAVKDARTEIMAELHQASQHDKITQEFLEIYPDLRDPRSEFSQAVENEKLSILRRGLASDDLGAYNIALHKVSAKMPQRSAGESHEDYATRRRIEDAGGEGAPTRTTGPEDEPKDDNRLTKSDMELGRKMGLDMSDKDTRKRVLARKKLYEKRRQR